MDIRSVTLSLYISLILISFPGLGYSQSQDLKPLKSLELKNADLIDVDGRGNIFVSDNQGTIRQFDPNGEALNIYSTPFTSGLQQLECHWTVNLFLFSSALQQIEILDRFLNPLSRTSMAELGITGLISHATLGNNNIIWLFDETDLNLRKFNFRNKQIEQEQPLNILLPDSKLAILSMIERKNLLFLQVKDEGIYVFDNQGNLIRKIPLDSNHPVEIVNESIYFLRDQVLVRKNYLNDKENEFQIPKKAYHDLALSNNRLVLKRTGFLDIYERPPDL